MLRALSLLAVFLSLGQTALDGYVSQTNLGGTLYLVNRQYALTPEYEPPHLVRPDVPGAQSGTMMLEAPARALERLFAAARNEAGHELLAVSGYRSYARQAAIWQRKVNSAGSADKAQRLVAPPGTSEHQLGLAMDVARKGAANLNHTFGDSPQGKWVSDNAHRFGFIIRYKAEWTDITGYAWEPWHLRYVGEEHAGRIHAADIPLEHYLAQLSLAAFGHYIAEDLP